MMKLGLLLLAVIANVLGQNDTSIQTIIKSHIDFAIELYMNSGFQELFKLREDNIAYSTISLQTTLALSAVGAKGATADQLRSTMHLNLTDDQIKKVFKLITTTFDNLPDITVEMATKAYLAEGLTVDPDFLKIATEDFHTSIDNVNFAASKETAGKINSWFERETNNKITKLIREDQLDSHTRLMLFDTIYLHGNWLTPFDVGATEKRDFHISKTETVQVDTMRLTTYMKIGRIPKLNLTVLEWPFENKKATFTLTIPDEIDGYSHAEENLPELWSSRNFTTAYVQLFMPKFRVESTHDMIPFLKKMGITNLFTPGKADLSGVTKDDVYVSSITQKTYVDVNEFGVEATSATSDIISKRVGITTTEDPQIIKVDHPFLYCIQYEELALVAGRMRTP